MRKFSIFVLAFSLSSCAIYSHETMISTYVLEGGLDYYKQGKASENAYYYDVHIKEKTPSTGDLHNYRTDSTEFRMKTASYLLGSKYHTGCQKVSLVSEEPYQEASHHKKWLIGTWWKVKVLCESPTNPKENKYS